MKTSNIYKQSYNLFINGQYKAGIDLLEKYLKNNKGNGSIYNNLGAAYMKIGNYKEAKINFDKAIKLDGCPNNIYYNLTEYYIDIANLHKESNFELAISQLKKALENITIYLNFDKTNENAIELKNSLENYLYNKY